MKWVVRIGLICAVAVAGCGQSAPHAVKTRPAEARPAPTATPRPARPLLYLHTTNGADPIVHELTIGRDGSVTFLIDAGRGGGNRVERHLSAQKFARIRRLAAHARLVHADRSTIPTPGGSSYILRMRHHTVVFSDGHVAPSVRPLLEVLAKLDYRLSLIKWR